MSIWSWDGIVPVVDPEAFVHPDATVLGDVIIGPGVYIGPQCVLRDLCRYPDKTPGEPG